jgi:formate hydrogenlyase subunit 6/NADH:ubiquinone oxidoreductase subunit I
MLYRTVTKARFHQLIELMIESDEVIGPRQIDTDGDGRPIHQFLPVESPDELDLDYRTTGISAKTYFLPYRENLSEWRFTPDSWKQEISYRLKPRAIVGLHACDINALLKLDKVLARDSFPSPYYVSRRKNTFIVGIDHEPCSGAFCRSLGTDTADRGFDLFLTPLLDRYFVAIGSESGYTTLHQVAVSEVTEQDTADYLDARRRIAAGFGPDLDVKLLPKLMDIEFESDVWDKWGAKCFSCGSCAMVCPTCYCYGVSEQVAMDFSHGAKVRQLYSCNLVDFATVAGGHNFRPRRETRLKYRYYHQHRGFVEAYDEPKCVGCGRCGRACLGGINPPDVIRDLLEEEERV